MKMLMFKLLSGLVAGLFVIGLSVSDALASGTMLLEGTVRSFTAEMIELTDGQKVYKLDRKKIMQPIKKIKAGDKLALNVPFEAITGVKPVTK
jgi:alpha-acetolactate decarboxylase